VQLPLADTQLIHRSMARGGVEPQTHRSSPAPRVPTNGRDVAHERMEYPRAGSFPTLIPDSLVPSMGLVVLTQTGQGRAGFPRLCRYVAARSSSQATSSSSPVRLRWGSVVIRTCGRSWRQASQAGGLSHGSSAGTADAAAGGRYIALCGAQVVPERLTAPARFHCPACERGL
jgi:hypothetical protein